MNRKSLGLWTATTVWILAVVVLPALVSSAEEPETAQTEEPETARTQEPTDMAETTSSSGEAQADLGTATASTTAVTVTSGTTRKPRSLADLAGGINLVTPQGEGSNSIVITNENLQEMGKGAVVSEGSNIGGSSVDTPMFVPFSTRTTAPSEDDIEAARRNVETLETQAGVLNQAVEENKSMNLYTGGGPQYRAPGQADPLRDQQSEINKQLSDARAKLSAMEKAAAKAGASGSSPASPSAAGNKNE